MAVGNSCSVTRFREKGARLNISFLDIWYKIIQSPNDSIVEQCEVTVYAFVCDTNYTLRFISV